MDQMQTEQRARFSPYAYMPGMEMITGVREENAQTDEKVGYVEKMILSLLATYRLLTKPLITYYISRDIEEELEMDSYGRSIRKLYDGGYLRTYSYDKKKNASSSPITVYEMTQKGIKAANENGIKVHYNIHSDDEYYDTPTVLTTLTLNLWVKRIDECLGGYVKNRLYEKQEVIDSNYILIPSMFRLEGLEGTVLNEMTLFALPYNKDPQKKGAFLNDLLNVNSYINHNSTIYTNSFIIVLVDGMKQMQEAERSMRGYKPLNALRVYYAVDLYISSANNPLEWIFMEKVNSAGLMQHKRLNLMQTKEKEKRARTLRDKATETPE